MPLTCYAPAWAEKRWLDYCNRYNAETDDEKRRLIDAEARGYRRAVEDMGYNTANFCYAGDYQFIDRNIDRPTCFGMLLDIWEHGPLSLLPIAEEARAA